MNEMRDAIKRALEAYGPSPVAETLTALALADENDPIGAVLDEADDEVWLYREAQKNDETNR